MSEKSGYRFKTFSGVFLPSILTIVGVVLFMRLGTVVGKLGIFGALGILLFAESIAIATGLSISAISTNTKVENGGPYFLISRSLGAEFGSSIGLTYFVSQSLSVPFYILGFTEAVISVYPPLANYILIVNFFPLVLLFGIAFIGANWAIKAQYFIFALLILSILAIFAGGFAQPPTGGRFLTNWAVDPAQKIESGTLILMFAIFFPAVTGFLAGVNMSGDLENPRKSIPFGTMTAIFAGLLLYAGVILLVGAAYPRESLIKDAYRCLCQGAIAKTQFLIVLGVVAATLSSALGTLVGAPRILQAFAADNIFPSFKIFAYGRGKSREPVVAMFLTFIIAAATIWWGTYAAGKANGNALNAVAELVTMFTLSTYAIINIATAVEAFAANPSFRPQFRVYHWLIGLYGALASVIAAVLINPTLMVIAFVIIGVLFLIVRRKTLDSTFGDARRGYYFERFRRALAHLAAMPADAKNWRPEIFVLVGSEAKHQNLIRCAALLNNDRGILTVGRIIVAQEDALLKRRAAIQRLESFSQDSGMLFFPTVAAVSDEDKYDGALTVLLQSRDFGPLTPNIVLSGWPSRAERAMAFCHRIQVIRNMRINNLLYRGTDADQISRNGETIDVWWRGKRNGTLMLILAHLLNCSWSMQKKTIRLLRLIPEGNEADEKRELEQLIDDARIPAEPVIITNTENFSSIFHKYSGNASVVFLGFITPDEANFDGFFSSMNKLLDSMPATFLVSSAGDTDIDS